MEFKLLAPCMLPPSPQDSGVHHVVHALVSVPAGGTQELRIRLVCSRTAVDAHYSMEAVVADAVPTGEVLHEPEGSSPPGSALLKITLPAAALDLGPASAGVPICVLLQDPGGTVGTAAETERPTHDHAYVLVLPEQTCAELQQLWDHMVDEVATQEQQGQQPCQADDQLRRLLSPVNMGPPSSDRALWPSVWRQYLFPLLRDLASLLHAMHALPAKMGQLSEASNPAQLPAHAPPPAPPPQQQQGQQQGRPSTPHPAAAAAAAAGGMVQHQEGVLPPGSGGTEAGAGTGAAAPTHGASGAGSRDTEAGAGTSAAASTVPGASGTAAAAGVMHQVSTSPQFSTAGAEPICAEVQGRHSLSLPNLSSPPSGEDPSKSSPRSIMHPRRTPAPLTGISPAPDDDDNDHDDALRAGPSHTLHSPVHSTSAQPPCAEILTLAPASSASQATEPAPFSTGAGDTAAHTPELPHEAVTLMSEGTALALGTLPIVDRVSGYLRQQPNHLPGLLRVVEDTATACHHMLVWASEQLAVPDDPVSSGLAAYLCALQAEGTAGHASPSAPSAPLQPAVPSLPLSVHDLPELPPSFLDQIALDTSLEGPGPAPPWTGGRITVAPNVHGLSSAQHHHQHSQHPQQQQQHHQHQQQQIDHTTERLNWLDLPRALGELMRVTVLGFQHEPGGGLDRELEGAYQDYLIFRARRNSIFRVALVVVLIAAILFQSALAPQSLGHTALYLLPLILKLATITYPAYWSALGTTLSNPAASPHSDQAPQRPLLISHAHAALARAALLMQAAWWMLLLAGGSEAHVGFMITCQLCFDFCTAVGGLTVPVPFIEMLPCLLIAMVTPFLASLWAGSTKNPALRYGSPCNALSVVLAFVADMHGRYGFVQCTLYGETLRG